MDPQPPGGASVTRRAWSEAELSALRTLARAGLTDAQVAQRLKRGRREVEYRRRTACSILRGKRFKQQAATAARSAQSAPMVEADLQILRVLMGRVKRLPTREALELFNASRRKGGLRPLHWTRFWALSKRAEARGFLQRLADRSGGSGCRSFLVGVSS